MKRMHLFSSLRLWLKYAPFWFLIAKLIKITNRLLFSLISVCFLCLSLLSLHRFPLQGLQGEIFTALPLTNKLNKYGNARTKRVFDRKGGRSLPRLQSELSLQVDDVEKTATLQSWQGCKVQT